MMTGQMVYEAPIHIHVSMVQNMIAAQRFTDLATPPLKTWKI